MKNINIIDDSKSPLSYNGEYIEELSTVVLGLKKFSNTNLSIILSNKEYVSKLKKQYFGIDVYTDVIAFNLEDNNDCLDGEIYISIEDVLENAKIYSITFDMEFKRVLVHGILHLLGYKDSTDKEKKIMRNLENKYLLKFNKEVAFLQ